MALVWLGYLFFLVFFVLVMKALDFNEKIQDPFDEKSLKNSTSTVKNQGLKTFGYPFIHSPSRKAKSRSSRLFQIYIISYNLSKNTWSNTYLTKFHANNLSEAGL